MLLRAPLSFVAASGATGSPSGSTASGNADNAAVPNSGPRDGHDALPSAEFAAWTRTATSDDGTGEAASFGVRMLARMGFRQRLGRHETGIINPVSLASHSSTAGLGFSEAKRKAPSSFGTDFHDSASSIASASSKQQRVAPPPPLTIHHVLPSRSLPALATEDASPPLVSSMPTHSSAAPGERGLGSSALRFAHLLVHASALLPTCTSQLLRTSWATILHSLILDDDAPVVIPAFPLSALSASCPFGAALVCIDTDAESDAAVLVAILHAWAAVLTAQATDATMVPRCERVMERIRLLLDDEAAQYDVIERVEADYCARAKGRLRLDATWSDFLRRLGSSAGGRVTLLHVGSRLRCNFDADELGLRRLGVALVDGSCLLRSYRPHTSLFEEAVSRSRAPFDKCLVVATSIAAIQDCHATSQQLSCVLIRTDTHTSTLFTHTFALATAAVFHAALSVSAPSTSDPNGDEEQRLVLDTTHAQQAGAPDAAGRLSSAQFPQYASTASAADWLPAVGSAVRCVFADDQRYYPATVLSIECAAQSDQRDSAIRVRVVYDAPWGNEDIVALNKATRADPAAFP